MWKLWGTIGGGWGKGKWKVQGNKLQGTVRLGGGANERRSRRYPLVGFEDGQLK